MNSDPTNHDGPPPQVPDLDLIRCIGRGGFGEVWLALNRTTGRLRAVKLILLGRSGGADPAGREIASLTHLEAQAGMQHPALLGIDHVGKTDRHLFYIMDPADDLSGKNASCNADYCPATLARRLEAGPLETTECLRYARQLLAGLAHLHAAGMVHRDVKPGNCLFVGGQLKLADFGLLTPLDPQASRVGTARYMPPDGQMNARADVYAAGLVIYEMMTGLSPESLPSLGSQIELVAEDTVLQRLNRLVLRACQRDPELRFADAREMLAAIDTDGDVAIGARRGRPWIVVAICLLFALVAGVAGVVGLRSSSPPLIDVNFITEPFEATIYIDGELQLEANKTPYLTPCTVTRVSARRHSVVFKHEGMADRDVGEIDFFKTREVIARWND